MNVAWMYPLTERDGISLYGRRFVHALQAHGNVTAFDIRECNSSSLATKLENGKFDIVHIQYETSFFMRGHHDWYLRFCRRLRAPRIVTLHEIYEQFPGVFPREHIRGSRPVKALKRIIYDFRHPSQTMYARHRASDFCAEKILVHYPYQQKILLSQGITPKLIDILPHPVFLPAMTSPPPVHTPKDATIKLGSTGFININYNYDLLFATLDTMNSPWHFTWIGGIRQSQDQALLESLRERISHRGWENRFIITGWLSDKDQARCLASLDIYLALFSNRSTSGSLTVALGAQKPIVATSLPLTEDINGAGEVVRIVNSDTASVRTAIQSLSDNTEERKKLLQTAARYVAHNSYACVAQRLYRVYESLLGITESGTAPAESAEEQS